MKVLDRLPKPFWARAAIVAVAVIVVWTVVATVHRFLVAPRQAAQHKAEAVVQTEANKAASGAAQDALTTVTEIRREVVRIDDTTRRNDHAIKSAAGAATRAPGVAAALHDSLCQRAAYHGEPDCATLQRDGGGLGPARPDAGGSAAGE